MHQRRQNEKRDIVTDIVWVTETAPNVVVFVDQNGNPVMTSTEGVAPASTSMTTLATMVAQSTPSLAASGNAAPAPAAAAPAPVSYPPVAASANAPAVFMTTITELPAVVTPMAAPPVVTSPTAAASTAAAVPASANTPSTGLGIVYSPYDAAGNCKSAAQVVSDLASIPSYSLIRVYGVDCAQVSSLAAAATAHNSKLFLGLYNLATLGVDIASMAAQLGGDWSRVDTVSVGNELVNSGQASPAAVVAAISVARTLLAGVGYHGPVVTVDTVQAILNHPELAAASDYAAINAHAFFDGNVPASGAGPFIASQAALVRAATGKRTVVTESGWPHAGNSNNKAEVGPEDQQAAISSLRSSFSSDLILFSAFDDLWKKDNAWTFGCEKHWGIYN